MAEPIYPNRFSAGRSHQAIAVGSYVLQLTPRHGYSIEPALTTQAPLHWARTIPIDLQPPPPAVIFGREREIRTALHALQSERLLEISGAPGSGKTALVRYLAQVTAQTSFADGALYLSAYDQPVDDLLQIIFHAFFETQSAYHPGALQIRQDMQYKRALIILDDVNLSNDALLALMSALANCTFLIASTARHAGLDGPSITLGALQMHEALALLEHELGRALRADEKGPASTMCNVLDANPLRIIQAAALARSRGRTLLAVANKLTSQQSANVLPEQIIESLSEQELQIIDALAIFDHAPVHISHIHALVDVADVAGTLNKLQQSGVVQNYGSSFRLNNDLSVIIRQRHDLSAQYLNALDHFSQWAAEHDGRASGDLAEIPALLQLFGWAATNARWQEVLALYTATEDRLVISQRWDAWDAALLLALSAARSQKDRVSEARLLHQHGTRALCLGQPASPLISALRLRESLQDYEGAKVTQHNLQMKLGTPKPHRPPPAQSNWMRRMMILFGPLAIAIVLIFFRGSQPDTSKPIAQVTPTPFTPVVMVVLTDTLAPPTDTPVPSPTPTSLPVSDLMIQNLKVMPNGTIHTDGSIDAPVQFELVNTGQGEASDIDVTFTVEGSPIAPLDFAPRNGVMPNVPAGGKASYDGTVHLGPEYAGEIVRIIATAHNCAVQSSDSSCQSAELNTANNVSQEILYTPPEVLYDFVSTGNINDPVNQAAWHGEPAGIGNSAVPLELGNSVNEMRGSAFIHTQFKSDTGEPIDQALVMQPAQGRMSTVVGLYAFPGTLRAGDYLVVRVGLHESASRADIQFIVEFYNRNPNRGHSTIGQVHRKYGDGMIYCEFKIPYDLDGEAGSFQLTVRGNTDSTNDLAVWEMARLMRQP